LAPHSIWPWTRDLYLESGSRFQIQMSKNRCQNLLRVIVFVTL
jgi:hypothetical protein